MSLLFAAGLTVVSTATLSGSPPSWSCAYVAERLPRSLGLLGDDTVSAGETRAARRRLDLSDAVLTRASNLALARSLGATRLVVVRCFDEGHAATLEAQEFDTESPGKGETIRIVRPILELPAAVDLLARRLQQGEGESRIDSLKPPGRKALTRAGDALLQAGAHERAVGLIEALREDPASIDLRLSTVEALMAARDFDGAARIAGESPGRDSPASLVRVLRFQGGAALLESGRYEEGRAKFEELRRERESAAVLNNLGVAMFRLRKPDASLTFERATFLSDPRRRDIAFNRSLALVFEGRSEAALPFLDAALGEGLPDVRTRLLRVWALGMLGRTMEREEEWGRLMAIAPSFSALGKPDVARRLERIFPSERNPGALSAGNPGEMPLVRSTR